MTQTSTVGVVEDNPAMQQVLSAALARDPRWRLEFVADSVAEIRLRFMRPGPDVLLLDLGLPDGSGLDLLAEVREHWPACECLVVSMFGDEARVIRSIEAGASGYILKGQGEEDVAEHLGYLLEGGSPMSPAVARHLLRRFGPVPSAPSPTPQRPPAAPAASPSREPDALTSKEFEVLRLLARGEPYDAVATRLGVTVNTVRFHVKSLYSKLGVNTRQRAVVEATRRRLIDPR